MKLLYFNDYKLGVLKGDNSVVDVTAIVQDIPHTGPGDLINGLIERFSSYRQKLEQAVAQGQGVPLASVRIRPPLPKPTTIDSTIDYDPFPITTGTVAARRFRWQAIADGDRHDDP